MSIGTILKNGDLYIEGRLISTEFPVKKVLACGKVVVAMLSVPTGVVMNDNVFAYDKKGHCIWKMHRHSSQRYSSPIVDIESESVESLRASDWSGIEYTVDLCDGSSRMTDINRF